MARENARAQCLFYPTQNRIIPAIARLFQPPKSGKITLLDCCAGDGRVLAGFKQAWGSPTLIVKPYAIEIDKARAKQCEAVCEGGEAIWAAIEDVSVGIEPTVHFMNPPYDLVRGAGRMELLLFQKSRRWVQRAGHLIMVLPDYVLSDISTGMAVAIERDFRVLAVYHYPAPEKAEFKQCVLIGQRRDKALSSQNIAQPHWSINPSRWPTLPLDGPVTPIQLLAADEDVTIHRVSIGKELFDEIISKSPLRSALLREAMAPPAAVERPLLPLRDGHLALALAGGLCDGIIEDAETGIKFLIKGSLASAKNTVAIKDKFDDTGEKIAEVNVIRTVYRMDVRCLKDDGTIENHSSHEVDEAAELSAAMVAKDDEDVE